VLNRFLLFTLFLLPCFKLSGQCTSVKIETDAFDSTRVIYDKPLNIGGLVTSNFEVEEGNKMVEEAKLLVTYAENDSIESFFSYAGFNGMGISGARSGRKCNASAGER